MSTHKCLWALALLVLVAGCTSCGGGAGGTVTPTVGAFDQGRAFDDLEAQCNYGPRIPGSEAHTQCLAWLAQQLATADTLVKQTFESKTPFGGPYSFTNLVAVYGKDQPGVPFLLCAHWDSRPKADEDPLAENRDDPVPGANDGASGVAVLLELARLMHETTPPRPVVIALLDAEDSGKSSSGFNPYQGFCIGAEYLANHWPSEIARPAEGVLLDLVGGDDVANPRLPPRFGGNDYLDFPIEANSQDANTTLVNAIWSKAEERSHLAFKRTVGRNMTDDHLPFIAAGIKVIDIIDFPPPEWHTVDDTPEHCSPAALAQTGDTLLHYLYD